MTRVPVSMQVLSEKMILFPLRTPMSIGGVILELGAAFEDASGLAGAIG